jgi:hypothetical protein
MKTLLKALAGIILVLFIGLGFLLWNLNPLIDSLRPVIVSKLSEAVGHQVEIGGISLSLFPVTGIELEKLKLESSTEDTYVNSLVLETSLGDLLSKKITVNKLNLNGASLRITKQKDGSLFLGPMLLTAKTKEAQKGKVAAKGEAKDKDEKKPANALAIALSAANISALELIFVDESLSPAQEISVRDLDLELRNISETSSGTLELTASLLGTSSGNLGLKGQLGLKKTPLGIPHFDLDFSLVNLDLEKVKQLAVGYGMDPKSISLSSQASLKSRLVSSDQGIRVSPVIDLAEAGLQLPGLEKESGSNLLLSADLSPDFGASFKLPPNTIPSTSGSLQVEAERLELSEKKDSPLTVSQLKVPLKFAGKTIMLEPVQLKINDSPVEFSSTITLADLKTPVSATLNPLKISAFQGTLSGRSKLNLRDKNLALDISGGGFDLESVSKALLVGSPLSVSGTVKSLALSATSPLSAKTPSAKGELKAELVNGTISGINIARETLGSLDEIPGLEGSLSSRVPEKYQPLLKQNSTQFDNITLRANIAGSTVRLQALTLSHQLFTLNGTGEYLLDGSFLLNAQFKLPVETSSEMLEKEKNLKSLLNQDGQLVIPLSIKKDKNGAPLVFPDVEELGKLAIKNQAKDKAKKSLEKYVPGAGGLIDSLF